MTEEFIDIYQSRKNEISRTSPDFMKVLRDKAIEQFRETGLPDRKNELYRYTRIDQLFGPDYSMLFEPSKIDLNIDEMFTCDVPNLHTNLEIVLNGFYFKQGKELRKYPEGVIVMVSKLGS